MSDRNVATMAKLAAIASSGASVDERVDEVIECLGAIIPIAAAAASRIDPCTGQARILVNTGYGARIASHVVSDAYHAEVIKPWALPLKGWPVRERDLPVDPLTLRCNVEYFRPAGLTEGLVSALISSDGRFVGVLDVGVSDRRHPSDDACAVIGHLAPMLANLLDPLQSAGTVATLLGGSGCTALCVLGDGDVQVLRGTPRAEILEHLDWADAFHAGATRVRTPIFLLPAADGGWYGCRMLRCNDGVLVVVLEEDVEVYGLTHRELEVLTCLADGLSNAQIAAKLWITARTARAHVEHILTKLGVVTRSAAVARALREGLVLGSGGSPTPVTGPQLR